MNKPKAISYSVMAILCMIIMAFVLELGGLKWQSFFAPKHEDVKRGVFEATRSYNHAKIQELAKYKMEYDLAKDPVDKAVIANTIRHQFAAYDDKRMPDGLKTFLKKIRGY